MSLSSEFKDEATEPYKWVYLVNGIATHNTNDKCFWLG